MWESILNSKFEWISCEIDWRSTEWSRSLSNSVSKLIYVRLWKKFIGYKISKCMGWKVDFLFVSFACNFIDAVKPNLLIHAERNIEWLFVRVVRLFGEKSVTFGFFFFSKLSDSMPKHCRHSRDKNDPTESQSLLKKVYILQWKQQQQRQTHTHSAHMWYDRMFIVKRVETQYRQNIFGTVCTAYHTHLAHCGHIQ